MNLLELRFYPIEGKQDGFKVSVEGSSGEVHHEPVLPFLDSETPDALDRRFTIVKILESTKFNEKSFSQEEQAWMVREQLLLAEQNAFHPQGLATIGRRLFQVLGQNIRQVIETAVADAKRDRILTATSPGARRNSTRDSITSNMENIPSAVATASNSGSSSRSAF